MQDNLLLVEHKKGRCNCQDGPIFREFFLGGWGGGRRGRARGNLSFINLVLKNKGRGLQFLPLKKALCKSVRK